MKKSINKIIILAFALATTISCEEPDNAIYDVFDGQTYGAVLRTLERTSTNFNLFDPSSTWGVVIEEQDEEKGDLLQKVDLYLSYTDNKDDGVNNSKPEILFASYAKSVFTTSANGLPSIAVSVTLAEAVESLGLSSGQYKGGDTFNFRFEVVLTDGRTFSSADASGSLEGSYFQSPYVYLAGMLCIPASPFTGDYKIDMQDSYGDGWQGSKITVTIDGNSTDYSIPDLWTVGSGNSAEVGTSQYTDATATVTVPDGTSSLSFSWTSGDYPSETTFQIYAPSGNLVADGGPSPTDGEIALNLCDE